MKIFDGILLRLKAELGMAEDKEVALLLGMSPNAFTARKRRDAFPEEKLLALKSRRPDLQIDETYILTGVRKSDPERSNVEKAQRISREVDGGAEGPLSETLNRGLADRSFRSEARKVLGSQLLGRGLRPESAEGREKLLDGVEKIFNELDWMDPEYERKAKSILMKEIFSELTIRSLNDMELVRGIIERLPVESGGDQQKSGQSNGEKA